ncbi:MAG TPA: glycosyltransferase, partial [Ktedonobacterales bacterium]|nr:glycosyltransferase [Ktedonobacterales bacterium]
RLSFWSWRRRKLFAVRQYLQALNLPFVRVCREELRAILAQYPDAKGVAVFPPSAPWYADLYQRPHQIALALARLGYVVLYWIEDINGDYATPFREVTDRLYLCNVPGVVLRAVKRPIVIAPTRTYKWARLLRSPVIVYEPDDHLDTVSNMPARVLKRYHRRLLKRARVVVGTSDALLAEVKPYRPDAILCPNGVDPAHFAAVNRSGADDIPLDMRPIMEQGKPIFGYSGAMAEWLDFDLVEHAAETLPDYQFVLIGPDFDGLTMQRAGIDAYPNIHWLGPKQYAELPRYLACFDVATLPFKVSEASNAMSPITLFEYMAGGRPIVTADLAECRKYPVVLTAGSHEQWVARLQEALRLLHDDAHLAELRRTAEENTWTARAWTEIQALDASTKQSARRSFLHVFGRMKASI